MNISKLIVGPEPAAFVFCVVIPFVLGIIGIVAKLYGYPA